MKKSAIGLVLGISLIFVSNSFGKAEEVDKNKSAISETTASLSTWMTDNYEKIKYKQLRNLVIPGTHDSGTAKISKENAVVSSDKRIPAFLAKIAPEKLVGWSKTQDLTILEQLKIGVRFFDFRVSIERGSGNNDYILYLSHGLRGERWDDVLTEIRNFAQKNPHEIIMIKVKSFPDEKCRKENWNDRIARSFLEYLDGLMIQRQDIDVELPLATIEELINTQKNIIVLFEVKRDKKNNNNLAEEVLSSQDFLFDSGSFLGSPWGNKYSVPELVKYTVTQAKDYAKDGKCSHKLYSLHWTLTANVPYIISHIRNDEGIRYLTNKLNEGKKYSENYSLAEVLKSVDRVNIVLQDFITPEKTRFLINLNWPIDLRI